MAPPAKSVAKAASAKTSKNATIADELQLIAEKWSHSDLLNTWNNIKARRDIKKHNKTSAPSSKKPVPQLTSPWAEGKLFEYMLIRAFQLEGAEVRWPYSVTLKAISGVAEQLDGAIYINDRVFLVESKDYGDSVPIEALAKLRYRLERRPPSVMGIVFSASGFSLPTEAFAQFSSPLNVLLWNGSDIDAALPHHLMTAGLTEKYLHACENGIPAYALIPPPPAAIAVTAPMPAATAGAPKPSTKKVKK